MVAGTGCLCGLVAAGNCLSAGVAAAVVAVVAAAVVAAAVVVVAAAVVVAAVVVVADVVAVAAANEAAAHRWVEYVVLECGARLCCVSDDCLATVVS